MRITLLAVLLFSCASNDIEPCKRMPLILSDSLPVQFWVNGEETFNEKEVCGMVKQDCFCQPFNCDDEIVIQVETGAEIVLQIMDSTESVIEEIEFLEVAEGVRQVEFIWNELASPAICDQKVHLKILTKEITNGNFAYAFDAATDWYNLGTGGTDWTRNAAGYATVTSSGDSDILSQNYTFEAGRTYTLNFDLTIDNPTNSIEFYVYLWTLDQSGLGYWLPNSSVGLVAVPYITSIVNGSYSITFTAPTGYDWYRLSFETNNTLAQLREVRIDNVVIVQEELAQSDCIDVKTDHECSVLIEYQNTSDFDGINYTSISPDAGFKLRIPAIFFEEDNPQEQEDLELSNGVIVTLRQSIVEKRKLETGFMPNYMHRKLQKILMHDSVYIDGDYWKKRDSYDTSPVKKYNLKTASVLLTKYDSVEKNTI